MEMLIGFCMFLLLLVGFVVKEFMIEEEKEEMFDKNKVKYFDGDNT